MTAIASFRSGGPAGRFMHWSAPATVTALVAGAVGYVALHNPHHETLSPPCMLLSTLGIYCPGCGGTRAVYDIAHGDFASALQMNGFVTLLVVPVAAAALAWWFARAVGVNVPSWRIPTWLIWLYVGALGAFWVLRNTPMFAPYLAP